MPPVRMSLERRLFLLAFGYAWLLPLCLAAGALPSGTFTATPDLPIKYIGQNNAVLYVRNATLVIASDGTAFAFYGTFTLGPSPTAVQTASFTGEAVCTGGDNSQLLISVDADSCSQSSGIPWFKNAAPYFFSAVVNFGMSRASNPTILQLEKWGGSDWPFIFRCVLADNACGSSTACNTTTLVETNLYVTGGTVNATDSNVFINGGENGTVVNFNGDRITLQQSNNVTFEVADLTELQVTVEGNENTVNVQPEQPVETVNFITTTASSCLGYADWHALRASNLTVSTVAYTLAAFSSGDILSPGGEWALDGLSAIEYTGPDEAGETGYLLTFCLKGAVLYDALSVGQRVLLALYNVTGAPVLAAAPEYSPLIYNHTNPAYIGTTCAPVILDSIYPGNKFSLYVALQRNDGSTGTAIIGPNSLFSLSIIPIGCQGSVNNYNLTLIYNDSTIEFGDCFDATFDPDTKVTHVDTDAPCDTDNQNYTCLNIEIDDNVLQYAFGGMCGVNNSLTITWEHLANGRWIAHAIPSNLTSCATCVEEPEDSGNFTLNLNRLCATTMCEVRADPPQSPEPLAPIPTFIPGWGGGGSDGDDDDDDDDGGGNDNGGNGNNPGGNNPPPPIVPPPGVILPVPILPVVPIVPIASGSTPIGDPPLPSGMYLPVVNFSAPSIPQCDEFTRSTDGAWVALNSGSQPERLMICQYYASNDSYAWTPYCPGCGTDFNVTRFIMSSTFYFANGSVVAIDQYGYLIVNGSSWFYGNVTLASNVDMCEASPKIRLLEACDGGLGALFMDDEETRISAENDLVMLNNPNIAGNSGLVAVVTHTPSSWGLLNSTNPSYIVKVNAGSGEEVILGGDNTTAFIRAYEGAPTVYPPSASDTIAPVTVDTENNDFYFFSSGAWRRIPSTSSPESIQYIGAITYEEGGANVFDAPSSDYFMTAVTLDLGLFDTEAISLNFGGLGDSYLPCAGNLTETICVSESLTNAIWTCQCECVQIVTEGQLRAACWGTTTKFDGFEFRAKFKVSRVSFTY